MKSKKLLLTENQKPDPVEYEVLLTTLREQRTQNLARLNALASQRPAVAAAAFASRDHAALASLEEEVNQIERENVGLLAAIQHVDGIMLAHERVEAATDMRNRVEATRRDYAESEALLTQIDAAMVVLADLLMTLAVRCTGPNRFTTRLAGAVNRGWSHIAHQKRYRSLPTALRHIFELVPVPIAQAIPLAESGMFRTTDLDADADTARIALDAAVADFRHLTALPEPLALISPSMALVGAQNDTDLLEAA